MKTHLEDNKPYECKICKLTYLHKSSLQKHMKTHILNPNGIYFLKIIIPIKKN